MTHRRYVSSNRLVFDLGTNDGQDAAYYLKKGLRVVAVEANPSLAKQASERFADAIGAGQLTMHQVAISDRYDNLPFYVSRENSHWSSLDSNWASRNNGKVDVVEVDCVPLRHLLAIHGVPTFMKIDIEGADEMIIDQLSELDYLPAYLSVEDCRFGFRYLEKLIALGYDGFKLSNQATVETYVDQELGHRFGFGSSGPMGEQLPGKWLAPEAILAAYADQVRTRENERRSPPGVWWDIHARAPQQLWV